MKKSRMKLIILLFGITPLTFITNVKLFAVGQSFYLKSGKLIVKVDTQLQAMASVLFLSNQAIINYKLSAGFRNHKVFGNN